ncbi:MAG: hypothetical protein M3253_05055, partial [Chloroflexota bacterium]|nr:hypothetical protein [Chloroflexota bacterium]
DVHQVAAHPSLGGCVLVASARGLGISFDGGTSWSFTRDGLHSPYARAVAIADDTLLLSASDGPFGGRAALYRREVDSEGPLERIHAGLPEWFGGNIDSGCVAATGSDVAFGTAEGGVYVSTDSGVRWSEAAIGLPPIRAVAVGFRGP